MSGADGGYPDIPVRRVAFQGEPGAYSEEAVRRLFGPEIETVPTRDFRSVGRAVAAGSVDAGLLPVENTLAGSVVGGYDVLAAEDLRVVAEVVLPIHHCVLGVPGATLDGLTRVLSHPVALAQCTRFLEARPGVEAVAVYDTAGAAKQVAEAGEIHVAAIAGRAAAERYGLRVLAAEVEDRPDNQTRFFAVVRAGVGSPLPCPVGSPDRPRKTALLVDTRNAPGALVRVLACFADAGINLSKLESRPGPEPWTYRFIIELEAGIEEPPAARAIDAALERSATLRVLGSFATAVVSDEPGSAAG